MAYYILNKGFKLRGWKGLPFALTYPDLRNTEFFDREAYHLVYDLDGSHDIEEDRLTEAQKKLLHKLIEQYKDRLSNRPTQDEPEPVRDC